MTAKSDVGALEASGLIGLASMEPELEYLFKHVLVQDAAYASLLKQERRALHLRVADALVQLYPERRGELAGVIGMHLEEAGESLRAAPFLADAGDHAIARFANREARAFYERAFAAIPGDAPDPEQARLRIRAGVAAVKAGWTFNLWPAELARLAELLPLADRLADPRLSTEVHFWNVFLRRSSGETVETSEALRRSNEALAALGETLNDPVAQAMPQAMLGAGLVFSGQLREGVPMLEKALPVLIEAGDGLGAGLLADVLTFAYARLGDFAAAEQNADRADRLAERGDPIARLDATIMRAVIASERGDLEVAVRLAGDCATMSETLGATSCGIPANYFLGDGRLRQGDAALAKAPFERSLQIAASEHGALTQLGVLARAGLASAASQLGDAGAATSGWDGSLAAARTAGDPLGEAAVRTQRAAFLAREAVPDWAAIVRDLEAAVPVYEAAGTRPALARALRAYGHALDQVGRTDDGRAALARSEALAEELGLRDRDAAA